MWIVVIDYVILLDYCHSLLMYCFGQLCYLHRVVCTYFYTLHYYCVFESIFLYLCHQYGELS